MDCNYSGAYVIIYTEGDVEGHGLTFTIGHGNDIGKLLQYMTSNK